MTFAYFLNSVYILIVLEAEAGSQTLLLHLLKTGWWLFLQFLAGLPVKF